MLFNLLLKQGWNDSVSDEEAGGEFDLWGNFTAAVPSHELYIHPYQTEPYPEIIIAKIPTTSAWEVAAWVPMGGFNSCPFPEEQAAVFSHWYQKYGAIPAVVTHDTWEMKLTRPPVDDITAEALAKEQFAFCSDIVYQAAGSTASIRGLASQLKDSTSWYFWWD